MSHRYNNNNNNRGYRGNYHGRDYQPPNTYVPPPRRSSYQPSRVEKNNSTSAGGSNRRVQLPQEALLALRSNALPSRAVSTEALHNSNSDYNNKIADLNNNNNVSTSDVNESVALNEKLRLRQEKWRKKKEAQALKEQNETNTNAFNATKNNVNDENTQRIDDKGSISIGANMNSAASGIVQSSGSSNSTLDLSPSASSTTQPPSEDLKKQQRRERLEAWKRKREAEKSREVSIEKPPVQIRASFKLNKNVSTNKVLKSLKPKKLYVKSVFEDKDREKINSSLLSRRPDLAKRIASLVPSASEDATAENDTKNTGKEDEDEEDELDKFFASIKDSESSSEARNTPEVILDDDNGEDLDMYDSDDQDDNVQDIIKKLENTKKTQQKIIPKVNHDEVEYEDFRKDFYIESQEISLLTKEEVEILRIELDGIKVNGLNPPNPVMNWSQLGLPSNYLNILLNDLQFSKPTPIQAQSIPAILQGRDVIGIAKTGSGKSLSFILPLFRHIKHRKTSKAKDPLAIILVPTRELAMQTYNVASKIDSSVKTIAVFGGENISKQINTVSAGVDLVIATPGRFIDLLSLRKLTLRRVTFLVIDEADRMFDMGFQPQINMIIDNIRPDSQKVLFSATFPLKLEKLARKILNHSTLEIKIGLKGVNDDIKQIVKIIDKEEDKFFKLLEVLGEFFNQGKDFNDLRNSKDVVGEDKVLVFVDRQEAADILAKRLDNRGYQCESLHGGKSQVERDTTINNFKKAKNKILIATSIAARGLDVNQLKLVINYDCPNHIEDYVHRVGRTGRAGSKGVAVSFLVKTQERAAYDIAKALKLSKVEVPAELEQISNEFLAKIKSGKQKVFSGFGGKGLEKLEAKRDENKKLIKQRLGNVIDGDNNDGQGEKSEDADMEKFKHNKTIIAKLSELSDFQVQEGRATDSPDSGAFHSKININDLPQTVRWKVTNRETMGKIIDETACAITSKGKFYKNLDKPLKDTDEPKLYLLVEGDTHYQVAAAVNLLKDKIIDGMKLHLADEAKKFTTGRYSVT